MRVSAAAVTALTCVGCLALAGCGDSGDQRSAPTQASAPQTPLPAPAVELTPNDEQVWARLPPDRSGIPVLLYHGIGATSDFSNSADAEFGVDPEDFAKQMTLIKHAGYQTVDLATFLRFVKGDSVDLPPRPLLLTFDDGRTDSWTGSDGILRKLHFNAVLFVDVGRVDAGTPEYLNWQQLQTMQDSGRWEPQLHAGHGHTYIRIGPQPDDTGPYYAYKEQGEDFDGWRKRVRSDVEWGQQTLSGHIPAYRPLAFALPYGNYGQDGTNDPQIPGDLLGWLTQRYDAVFTQDVDARARRGSGEPLGRIQVTRAVTGGDVHARLLSGEN
jgi:poly-beta-1,6-N-acetyl-D-glucosamine N-deacetylase